MYEGYKVCFRISLAMMIEDQEHILAATTFQTALFELRNIGKRFVNPDKLMGRAFKIQNFSTSEIDRVRTRAKQRQA
jgi:hypothetical protein